MEDGESIRLPQVSFPWLLLSTKKNTESDLNWFSIQSFGILVHRGKNGNFTTREPIMQESRGTQSQQGMTQHDSGEVESIGEKSVWLGDKAHKMWKNISLRPWRPEVLICNKVINSVLFHLWKISTPFFGGWEIHRCVSKRIIFFLGFWSLVNHSSLSFLIHLIVTVTSQRMSLSELCHQPFQAPAFLSVSLSFSDVRVAAPLI